MNENFDVVEAGTTYAVATTLPGTFKSEAEAAAHIERMGMKRGFDAFVIERTMVLQVLKD